MPREHGTFPFDDQRSGSDAYKEGYREGRENDSTSESIGHISEETRDTFFADVRSDQVKEYDKGWNQAEEDKSWWNSGS